MRVIVDGEILTGATGDDIFKIDQLLSFACTGRHALSFYPPEALDDYLKATRLPNIAALYKQQIDNTARSATTQPDGSATVWIKPTTTPQWADPDAKLPLDDALRLLEEPLGILVENNKNDWHFLLGIMGSLAREQMEKGVKEGWITSIHGGGNTLEQQLKERIENPPRHLRTFVLFDSDRRHPDELEPGWRPTPSETCQGFQFEQVAREKYQNRYWMLKRRFIESYMPRGKMENASHVVEAFFRLSQAGRWYFNIKNGFKGDEPVENRHRCKNLYDTVSPEDRAALENGLPKKLADRYQSATREAFDWDEEARQEASEHVPKLMRLL